MNNPKYYGLVFYSNVTYFYFILLYIVEQRKNLFVAALDIYLEKDSCTDTINIKHRSNLSSPHIFVYNTKQAPAMLLPINCICLIRKVNPDDVRKLF